jgi:hypothetical protein
MSFEALRWALAQEVPTPGAKLLLVALANHANRSGECTVSQAELARESSQSTRSVQIHTDALEAAGLVKVMNEYRQNKSQKSNRYQLLTGGQCEESSHCNTQDLRIEGEQYEESSDSLAEQCEESAPLVPTVLEPKRKLLPPNPPTGGETEGDRFEEAWGLYPKRAGGNPKMDARKAWGARLREGIEPAELVEGVLRYAEYVRAAGKEGTEFVMQAVRFFGPSERWREEYLVPAKVNGNGKHDHDDEWNPGPEEFDY